MFGFSLSHLVLEIMLSLPDFAYDLPFLLTVLIISSLPQKNCSQKHISVAPIVVSNCLVIDHDSVLERVWGVQDTPPINHEGPPIRKKNVSLGPHILSMYRCNYPSAFAPVAESEATLVHLY